MPSGSGQVLVGSLPRAEQRQANLYALAVRANAYEKTGFKGLSRFMGMIDKIIVRFLSSQILFDF